MLLTDVNVLVYASRPADERQERVRDWLQQTIDGPEAFGVSDLVLSGFLRIVTHPRAFKRPTTTADALRFAAAFRDRPNAVTVQPGPRHWEIFTALCDAEGVRGNLIPDAYLAALAIESGSEWITADRGFGGSQGSAGATRSTSTSADADARRHISRAGVPVGLHRAFVIR